MEQPLDKIKRLSKSLPGDDIKLADKFIANREFDKLLEIVESDIYLVQQNNMLDQPKEKYTNVDLETLLELRDIVEEYISFFETSNIFNNDWYD